jgi:peptidoglycan hydrolase-like protein with peptidoglycan-binding domain
MASIFISYSNRDDQLVHQYTKELTKRDHQVLMDTTVVQGGNNFQQALMKALADADGVIVFLTKNGLESPNVISEVGLARSNYDRETNKKFLIPLVTDDIDEDKIPYTIKELTRLRLGKASVEETVDKIEAGINLFFKENGKNVLQSGRQFVTLKRGSRGEDVKKVQAALNHAGNYNLHVDAIYGKATESAVRDFQKTRDLEATGEVDVFTFEGILSNDADGKGDSNASKVNTPVPPAGPDPDDGFIAADKADALQALAENFNNDINVLIKENYGWFVDTIDDQDALFGQDIAAALKVTDTLAKEANTWLAQPPRTGVQADVENGFKQFVDHVQKIISTGTNLSGHYREKLPKEEFELANVVLHQFVEKATQYKEALTQLEPVLFNNDPIPETVAAIIKVSWDIPFPNEETITSIVSDVPNVETADSLDIAPDVNALASVISYRKLTPPLAVGLFGNWGSGKSFFMKKLRKQIDVFAADPGPDYVERVVHIEFNSWHYSDSNLWASFVTKIFEDLDDYGKNHQDHAAAVKALFRQLNESSAFLTEANTNLANVKATIVTLEEELTKKKEEISEKAEQLSDIKLRDVASEIFAKKDVKQTLEDVKKQLPQKEIHNLNDIQRSIRELDGFVNKFVETIKLILSFKGWKPRIALLVFLIICTSPLWLFTLFGVQITDFFDWFGKYSTPVAIVLANLAALASYATVGLSKVQEKLKSLAGTYAVLEQRSLAEHQVEIDNIQSEIDVQKQAQLQKEAEINNLRKVQAEIQSTIDDIQSGRKLASFIAGRVTDQRYLNSLGLISWIRKDFQELDTILKTQREANKFSEKSLEEKKKIFQIDRIILYIDDLDRCNEEVVVKVLEAIHLLLAFELFVVIVGVDPRWMHKAIQNKYPGQLKKVNGKKEDKPGDIENDDPDAATSYDYLEKIFQVPFSLKEMNKAGRNQLIDDHLTDKEHDVIETPVPTDATHTTGATATVTESITSTKDTANLPSINPGTSGSATTPGTDVLPTGTKDDVRKTEEAKKNEEAVKRAKERLVISADEVAFMKAISELIGETPRTINRFINIYRIIRSHRNMTKSAAPMQDYCATMILLGIITGLANESEAFFAALSQKTSGVFQDLFEEMGNVSPTLKNACKVPFKVSALSEKTVGELPVPFIKQKFELVQRFSFRAYSD